MSAAVEADETAEAFAQYNAGREGFLRWLVGLEDVPLGDLAESNLAFYNKGSGRRWSDGMQCVTLSMAVYLPDMPTISNLIELAMTVVESNDAEEHDPCPWEERELKSLFWRAIRDEWESPDPDTRAAAEEYAMDLDTELWCILADRTRAHAPALVALLPSGAVTRQAAEPSAFQGYWPDAKRDILSGVGDSYVMHIVEYTFGVAVDLEMKPERAKYAPLIWYTDRTPQDADDHSTLKCQACQAYNTLIREGRFIHFTGHPLCATCAPAPLIIGRPELAACAVCGTDAGFLRALLCDNCRPQRAVKNACG